jgi:hypothetical protein
MDFTGRNGNGGLIHRPSSLVLPTLEECETPNAEDTPKSVEDIIKKFDPSNMDGSDQPTDAINNNDDLPPPPDYNDNSSFQEPSLPPIPQSGGLRDQGDNTQKTIILIDSN